MMSSLICEGEEVIVGRVLLNLLSELLLVLVSI